MTSTRGPQPGSDVTPTPISNKGPLGEELILRLKSPSAHINARGAIYARSREDDDEAKVTDVKARNTLGSRFVLNPGKYEYEFTVRGGEGKYVLGIGYARTEVHFHEKEFDSDVATQELIFRFDVPERGDA
jgi:hypothetical protein